MSWGSGRFGWGTFSGWAPQYNVTDQQLLSSVQLSLLESDTQGASYSSGIWTAAQVLDFLNNRMQKFLSESGLTVVVTYQPGLANQSRYALPETLIDIRRIGWSSADDPMAYVELPLASGWEMDHGRANWPTQIAPSPEVYMEDHFPSLTFSISPAPTDAGEIELIAVAQGRPVDGSGQFLSIPDDYSPYLAWGVRADMLASEYEGNDPKRAEHCEQRFQEGIELARLMIGDS